MNHGFQTFAINEPPTTTLIADGEHCKHHSSAQEQTCKIRIEVQVLSRDSVSATPIISSLELSASHALYAAVLARTMRGRCFFITEKGYIGIGPDDTQAQDIVWVLNGARVPLTIRTEDLTVFELVDGYVCDMGRNPIEKTGNLHPWISSNVRLVGDAYVHGIMEGRQVAQLWERQPSAFQYSDIV